jgi:excisionase family DNA binding protein
LPDEEYITVAQAARRFGLSARHLSRLLHTGTIPGMKPGHDWLVKPSAVMEYLRQQRKPGRKPRRAGESGT